MSFFVFPIQEQLRKLGNRFVLFFNETETRTSLLIRTQGTRELYKESQKEVVNKGDLEGSGGALGHLN